MIEAQEVIEFPTVEWGLSRIECGDLQLLSEVTGLTQEECLGRLRSYRPEEFAAAWRDAGPTSPAEILDFYAHTDLYLWELLGWNGTGGYESYLRRVDRLAEVWPAADHPRALDFGCGVGTAAVRLAERSYSVTIADVPGLTLTFARERLVRRGYKVEVLEIAVGEPVLRNAAWDVLVCFDVLEHVPDPARWARNLTKALVRGGGAAIVASFDWDDPRWPHHLADGRRRFGKGRWEMHLRGLGMANEGDFCYRRTGKTAELARSLQYRLWRSTGLYVTRIAR
jgi:SAM-dependent methyltransferase